MKALAVMAVLLLGSCQTTTGPVVTWPGVTQPPVTSPAAQTPRERLAEAERLYQAAMAAVGNMLSTGKLKAGGPNARLLGQNITETRVALDTWHIQPNNTTYMNKAMQELNDLVGMIRANGGIIRGSMG